MPLHHTGVVFQYPGYGVLVYVRPRVPECHLDVAHRHPHTRQLRPSVLYRRGTWRYVNPKLSRNRRPHTEHL